MSDIRQLHRAPLISVAMITYNHGPYIAQAIEGVIKQEVDYPIELVIGEDCSTDNTRDIVLAYQCKYPEMIRVLLSTKNAGLTLNLSRVENACRGRYIAYCEGDDYWHHPLKLQKQIGFLEVHPEVGLVHSECDFHYVESDRIVFSYYAQSGKTCDPEHVAEKLIDCTYSIITCTVCLRRNILKSFVGEHPDLFDGRYPCGDLQRWLGVALHSSIFFFNESLATRRVLPESASYSKVPNKLIEFCEKVSELRLWCIEEFHLSAGARHRVLIMQGKSLLWLSFLAFRPRLGRSSWLTLLKLGETPKCTQYVVYFGTQYKWANIVLKYVWRIVRTLFPRQYYGH